MKKNSLIVILGIVLSCLLCNSCENGPDMPPPKPPEPLAGVSDFYILKAEGSYDGVTLVNLQSELSLITLDRHSQSGGNLKCSPQWEGMKLDCFVPYRVKENQSDFTLKSWGSFNAEININGDAKKVEDTTLSGWVRTTEDTQSTSGVQCEIDVKCIVDGKELIFKIIEIGKDLPK